MKSLILSAALLLSINAAATDTFTLQNKSYANEYITITCQTEDCETFIAEINGSDEQTNGAYVIQKESFDYKFWTGNHKHKSFMPWTRGSMTEEIKATKAKHGTGAAIYHGALFAPFALTFDLFIFTPVTTIANTIETLDRRGSEYAKDLRNRMSQLEKAVYKKGESAEYEAEDYHGMVATIPYLHRVSSNLNK